MTACASQFPSVSEQRAIADHLDRKCAAIDRVVAEKAALIADLEAYEKSLIFIFDRKDYFSFVENGML